MWDVAALVRAAGDALARFGSVAVRGELAMWSRASSGHCYFTLKAADGDAALRCVMFRRAAGLLDLAPREGDLVEVRGRLAVYEPRGDLQFVVEALRRAGAGTSYERFLRLKAELQAQGLFDASRKRGVPPMPHAVGIVTSLGAAALHDVVTALARRAPHVRIVVYPAQVQGAQAPVEVVAAITAANQRAEVQVLLVCRGGGSFEDLWAFNDAAVVRAIAGSRLPVIVGVGHETDVTLSDFAADVRAPTPTAAAELVAVAASELRHGLQVLEQRMANAMRRALDVRAQRQDRAGTRLARPALGMAPRRRELERLALLHAGAARRHIERDQQLLKHTARRLVQVIGRSHDRASHAQQLLAGRLAAMDPRRVLGRGYVWLADAEGRAVTSVRQFSPGDRFAAELADGRVDAVVSAVWPPA